LVKNVSVNTKITGGRNMNTNRYIQDYLVAEHQSERLQEAEQRRNATHAASSHNALRHLIGRSGALLVALGLRMERIEQVKHETAFVAGGTSVSGRLR